jgi:uncharacterized protein (DUF58 family)
LETKDILRSVRKIEIKTRGLSKHVFAGRYHSAFKGRGMAFSEVREYHYGDDFRNVDWNVTARFNHPYVKVFEEERELTVMLLVDVSSSSEFGTIARFKSRIIMEIASLLSFSAIQNNDKVGMIMFSDRIESFIPPKKGRQHILRIIRELVSYDKGTKKTDLIIPLKYLVNAIRKRSIAFLISDFMAEGFEDALKIAGNKHDIVGLWIYDLREKELPDAGLIKVRDMETGKTAWIDTSERAFRESYRKLNMERHEDIADMFSRNGIDCVSISTGDDYVKPLMNLFKNRA